MSSSLLLNLIKKARNLINIPVQPAPALISSLCTLLISYPRLVLSIAVTEVEVIERFTVKL
ncbi:unnamed protein product [Nesidiocoris tenuis]|uniref:Uncharacterized protein n=1 Tax=Nesidiocoris tenuis TaxID=355587 RepID=A0A6H5H594_9HEMI|nr:unnamed protein product [Nesidiocoris tenuis]